MLLDGRVEKFWPNCAPLSVFASYNLHIPSCKHSNRGGEGVEDGVIAKSLLQKTDKTPNPREDKGDREGIPHTHPIP